jgi:hypothetical protein
MTGRKRADGALIAALASGTTVQAAAQRAGVSEATAQRRLRDPHVVAAIQDARDQMVERAVGVASDGLVAAAATLRKLLAADSDAIKLGAARSLLELGPKLKDFADLSREVAELKSDVEALKRQRGAR